MDKVLLNRSQVIINTENKNIKSDIGYIKLVIPQGSILGPLLFTVYLSDLCEILYNRTHSILNYADDTNLLITTKTIEDLERVTSYIINLIEKWMLQNQLILNINKTKYIVFKSGNDNEENKIVTINNENMITEECTKFLGIILDKHLNWTKHIADLRKN